MRLRWCAVGSASVCGPLQREGENRMAFLVVPGTGKKWSSFLSLSPRVRGYAAGMLAYSGDLAPVPWTSAPELWCSWLLFPGRLCFSTLVAHVSHSFSHDIVTCSTVDKHHQRPNHQLTALSFKFQGLATWDKFHNISVNRILSMFIRGREPPLRSCEPPLAKRNIQLRRYWKGKPFGAIPQIAYGLKNLKPPSPCFFFFSAMEKWQAASISDLWCPEAPLGSRTQPGSQHEHFCAVGAGIIPFYDRRL